MDFAQLLFARLTSTEKIKIRLSDTEGYLVALYWNFHNELSGSKFRGGTAEKGIEEMRAVREMANKQFREGAFVHVI